MQWVKRPKAADPYCALTINSGYGILRENTGKAEKIHMTSKITFEATAWVKVKAKQVTP